MEAGAGQGGAGRGMGWGGVGWGSFEDPVETPEPCSQSIQAPGHGKWIWK